MSVEKEIGFLINDVKRLMRREYLKRDLPMTPMQARALVYVSRYEGIRQVALAEILEIQPITTARLIDQLSEDGLVERRQDPTDRRAYCLYLAEGARQQLESIGEIVDDVNHKAVEGLSKTDVEQFVSTLKVIHKNLSDS